MELQFHHLLLLLPTLIGFMSAFKALLKLSTWIWVTFLRPPRNLKRAYGSWALVTGSTDGIGKAISFELASRGLNLVLLGRDAAKLDRTADEIHEKLTCQQHDVEIKKLVIDFSMEDNGKGIVRMIGEVIEGLDLGLVINNAGVSYPYAKFFDEVEVEMAESIVRVNVEAATWVTKAVVPVMLKKKKGAIVNIGSGSASLPSFPLYTVYAATKAYIEMFSKSISLECKPSGIDVQCQIPLLVATKMSSIKRSSMYVPSPSEYSKASVDCIGYEATCIPYWSHSLQWNLFSILPESFKNWFVLQSMLGMRNRGLLKDFMDNSNKAHESFRVRTLLET